MASQPPIDAFNLKHLCDKDAQALDALLDKQSGHLQLTQSEEDAKRQQKVQQLLALLDTLPANDADADDDLVEKTMARVAAAKQRERFATQVQMLAEPRRTLGVSFGQIAAAAVLMLVGASLLFPFLEQNRADANRIACNANLASAGMAFNQYAADFDSVLPRGQVHPGATWWNVGQQHHQGQTIQSNSAHLYILVRSGYLSADQLACPENVHAPLGKLTRDHTDWDRPEAVSYSYQNQYTPQTIRVDLNPQLAVLADKNPLFVVRVGRMTFDNNAPETTPSRIHGNRGQNVLRADGSATWTLRPMVSCPGTEGPDNIWMARGIRHYTGTESPASPDDSFLVP